MFVTTTCHRLEFHCKAPPEAPPPQAQGRTKQDRKKSRRERVSQLMAPMPCEPADLALLHIP
eukprot:823476-Lingulodinium_polyedra.AAC.1